MKKLALLLLLAGCAPKMAFTEVSKTLPRDYCYTLVGGVDVYTDGTTDCPDMRVIEGALFEVAAEYELSPGDFTESEITFTKKRLQDGGVGNYLGMFNQETKRILVTTGTPFTRQHTWHELSHAAIDLRFEEGEANVKHFLLDYYDAQRGDFDDR